MATKFNMRITYQLVGHKEDAAKYYEDIQSNPMMGKLSVWFKSFLQNEAEKTIIYSEWNFPSIVGELLATNMMDGVAKTIQQQQPNAEVTWEKVLPEQPMLFKPPEPAPVTVVVAEPVVEAKPDKPPESGVVV